LVHTLPIIPSGGIPVRRRHQQGTGRKTGNPLVSARDNLAHASDIVTHDWPQIARMARRIEDLATRTH